jgi:TonB-dependent SusC/RagA subfamily outer membrane receptor
MRVIVQSFILLAVTASAIVAQPTRGGRAGGSPTITTSSGSRPLIIVDGVVVSDACAGLGLDGNNAPSVRINGERLGRIAGLTTDEIENVEVLKGTAAAVYGPRAQDGVIVITTKNGQHYCVDRAPMSFNDPFAAHLFPPDLIMANQREIGLRDDQRTAIVNDMQRTQASFVDLQWKMSTESEQLERLLEAATVNESAVLAQIDRVLAAEREIKRAQVGLLIRIRNGLTAQQQARLAEIRKSSR